MPRATDQFQHPMAPPCGIPMKELWKSDSQRQQEQNRRDGNSNSSEVEFNGGTYPSEAIPTSIEKDLPPLRHTYKPG